MKAAGSPFCPTGASVVKGLGAKSEEIIGVLLYLHARGGQWLSNIHPLGSGGRQTEIAVVTGMRKDWVNWFQDEGSGAKSDDWSGITWCGLGREDKEE